MATSTGHQLASTALCACFITTRCTLAVAVHGLPYHRPAECSASRIASCWLGPLGAVRLLARPPWLTAVPASNTRAALLLPSAGWELSQTNAHASERT